MFASRRWPDTRILCWSVDPWITVSPEEIREFFLPLIPLDKFIDYGLTTSYRQYPFKRSLTPNEK